MRPLTIYKASAGSGKTYRLAMDYINLLLHDPTAYESILAVTFTNKATAEMKRRILMELWAVTQDEKRSIIERRKAEQGGLMEFTLSWLLTEMSRKKNPTE